MINYNFKHLENVPVQYMSNSQVADAVELDALISPVKAIQQKYDMDRVVGDVVRANQEAIDLANRSKNKNDLYPQANNFEGDDGDRLDRLHNEMDEAGDEAHDEDFTNIPPFANNEPEDRWRDLRALADSTFDAEELEEIVRRKKNGETVEHDLQEIESQITDWVGVELARDGGQEEEESSSDQGDGDGLEDIIEDPQDGDPGAGEPTPQRLTLLVGLAVLLFVVTRRL